MNDDIYFVCSFIEYARRRLKVPCRDVVNRLGVDVIQHIYELADVYHCMDFGRVFAEINERVGLSSLSNIDNCERLWGEDLPPDTWIGRTYARIVMRTMGDKPEGQAIFDVFNSFISDEISNFDTAVFYSPVEWLVDCYYENKLVSLYD